MTGSHILNSSGLLKVLSGLIYNVIPAEAGIQSFQDLLDPRFRGIDNTLGFFSSLLAKHI